MEALSLEASFRSVLASALAQIEQKLGSAHEDAVAELTTELAALKGRPVQGIDAREGEAEAESSERSQKGFSHVRGRPAMRPPSEMPEMLETVLGESQAALGPCHWEFIKGIWEVDLGDWEARAAAAVRPCGWEAQAAAAVGPCDAALAVAIGLARQALENAHTIHPTFLFKIKIHF